MNARRLLACSFFSLILIIPQVLKAQNKGFIYGKVTTVDDKEYVGAIRWGKEEVYWTDLFNAAKQKNENLRYLSRDERDELDEQTREGYHRRSYGSKLVSWVSNSWEWDDRYEHIHQFVCQFGEIQAIENSGRSEAYITLKNGDSFEVDGTGYNDVGSSVKILDSEIGEVTLDWSRIDKIEFQDTPDNLEEKFGEPLYGTVQTDNGEFEGYIQWDHDERVDTDKLDGDTRDGRLSIRFGKIESIEKTGNRSEVVLKSGREMTLRGTNDVDSDNKGIIISNEAFGRVDVPWDEFRKVTFSKQKGNLPGYKSFNGTKKLKGTVRTEDGENISGEIIYDLDESTALEVIQGKDDDLEFIIPFGKIKKIAPKNYDYSTVTLKNGDTLTLGESADLSDKNSGLLVFQGGGDPTYILWKDIESITFE